MRIRDVLPIFTFAALAAAACVALAAAACSSEDDTNGDGGGGTTATGTAGSGGEAGAGGSTGGSAPVCNQGIGEGGFSCSVSGGFGGGTEQTVTTVTADIVDLSGSPAANIFAELCGTNRCETATADASGHVNANGAGQMFIEPRLLYGDGKDWVKFAAPLPTFPDAAFGTIHAVALPAMSSGVTFAAGQDAVSGDVTLSLAANAYVQFNTLYYCHPEDQGFRAATIPLGGSEVFPAIDDSLNLELAYGLAPIDTKFCPAAQMTVPNAAGWTANAQVEFWFQGTTIFDEFAPFGGWEKVSDGTVSADGSTISTNPGEGIPQLGVIAIRLAP